MGQAAAESGQGGPEIRSGSAVWRRAPPVATRVARVATSGSGLAGSATTGIDRPLMARKPLRRIRRKGFRICCAANPRRQRHAPPPWRSNAARVAPPASESTPWPTRRLWARPAAPERATHPGDMARADLSSIFHATRQSLSTWRKTPRVVTGMPSSSRQSTRRSFQQRLPLSRF